MSRDAPLAGGPVAPAERGPTPVRRPDPRRGGPALAPPVREALLEELRRAFGRGAPAGPPRIGVELEWIPAGAAGGDTAPPSTRAIDALLTRCARDAGWRLRRGEGGALSLETGSGGRVSLEPGGQIEYSSPPFVGTSALLRDVQGTARRLRRAAAEAGVRLLSAGIDPVTPVERAELRVTSARYRRMARHLDRFGPAGRRMMRQTAALHVNLDFGSEPALAWRVANALVPQLIAIFANSARHAGEESGFRSFRARQWRELDPEGGALCAGAAPSPEAALERYLAWALNAPAILLGPEKERPVPFVHHLGRAGPEAWREHLSTLFPEVRPRGYLEIRSCDALPVRWLAAPIVFLTGILCEPATLRAVAAELAPVGRDDLDEAGRVGLRDPQRREAAVALFERALAGARRLEAVDAGALAVAERFFRTFTARGLDPATASAASAAPGAGAAEHRAARAG